MEGVPQCSTWVNGIVRRLWGRRSGGLAPSEAGAGGLAAGHCADLDLAGSARSEVKAGRPGALLPLAGLSHAALRAQHDLDSHQALLDGKPGPGRRDDPGRQADPYRPRPARPPNPPDPISSSPSTTSNPSTPLPPSDWCTRLAERFTRRSPAAPNPTPRKSCVKGLRRPGRAPGRGRRSWLGPSAAIDPEAFSTDDPAFLASIDPELTSRPRQSIPDFDPSPQGVPALSCPRPYRNRQRTERRPPAGGADPPADVAGQDGGCAAAGAPQLRVKDAMRT